MQPAYGGNAADQYLVQRINGASPEQLAAMLLEGAQRFLAQALVAMGKRDIPAKARLVNRVSAIIEELMVQLNHEQGGELVGNLTRLYEWWLSELFQGSQSNQADRLERVFRQMGELRGTWEELHLQKVSGQGAQAAASLSSGGMVG
jgi:flagellar secretion chaperone FliS